VVGNTEPSQTHRFGMRTVPATIGFILLSEYSCHTDGFETALHLAQGMLDQRLVVIAQRQITRVTRKP
jgi:hypothetical protein